MALEVLSNSDSMNSGVFAKVFLVLSLKLGLLQGSQLFQKSQKAVGVIRTTLTSKFILLNHRCLHSDFTGSARGEKNT